MKTSKQQKVKTYSTNTTRIKKSKLINLNNIKIFAKNSKNNNNSQVKNQKKFNDLNLCHKSQSCSRQIYNQAQEFRKKCK